jgi:hypothetical protein
MKWNQWKIGVLVAILTGIASGAVGLAIGLNRNQILILFATNIGKDLGLFLVKHPPESISFDTTSITKTVTATDDPDKVAVTVKTSQITTENK